MKHNSRTLTAEANKRTTSLKFWITLVALLAANTFLYFVNIIYKEGTDNVPLHFAVETNKSVTPSIRSGETHTHSHTTSLVTVALELNETATSQRSVSSPSSFAVTDDNDTPKEAKQVNGVNPTTSRQGQGASSAAGVATGTSTGVEAEAAPKKTKKLNVMVFYPDDWRHDTLGAAGTQPVQTPFLDQLAREGIRFTHNCVTTSVCWISRATMFTGQYLSRHKSQYVRNPVFYKDWNQSYPYKMQQNGYFVGHIGKWQFFDKDFVTRQYNWSSLYEGTHWYHIGREKTHSTVRDEREAIRFLRERPKDAPFVLTTAFYAPKAVGEGVDQHFPMDHSEHLYDNVTFPLPIDPEWAFRQLPQFMQDNSYYLEGRRRYKQRFDFNVTGMYERHIRKYFRMVSEVDEAIKHIVGELEAQGLLNETLIIFTTDNGLFTAEHGLAGKWFPHEESIRIPLIIKDPRMGPDRIGTLEDSFTLNIDVATTILGAAGLPPNPRMQGRDIADLYLKPDGKASWRKEFFYEHPGMGFKKGIPESSALVRKDFKYMFWPQYNYEQLFDLKNDPLEHNDIAAKAEYVKLLAEMRARHNELKKSVV